MEMAEVRGGFEIGLLAYCVVSLWLCGAYWPSWIAGLVILLSRVRVERWDGRLTASASV